MPYKNIVFVKLLWHELLHKDDRFMGELNDSQKGLYLMLLLLAGATVNNIKNDENYVKRVLNLSENTQNIRKNLDKICEVYPKLIAKNGFLKFKNFKDIHNYIGKSEGNPEDNLGIAKNRIDKIRIDKIRIEYVGLKGFDLKNFSSDDFGRTAKAIKSLLIKSDHKDDLVIQSLKWASEKKWCDWTLETVLRKWADFMKDQKRDYMPPSLKGLDK